MLCLFSVKNNRVECYFSVTSKVLVLQLLLDTNGSLANSVLSVDVNVSCALTIMIIMIVIIVRFGNNKKIEIDFAIDMFGFSCKSKNALMWSYQTEKRQ